MYFIRVIPLIRRPSGPESIMNFKQVYLGCLAHASYYIGSEGEAAVIDPQRDVQEYLDEAEANGQTIKYVIETHLHADFVSGHIELAGKTGAQIVYGSRAATAFPTLKVSDSDELTVGKINLKFLETPGHTPESITIVATDIGDADAPPKMFTGDTLFCGDVGRPDLVGSKGFSAEQMAQMLYDSLHEKLLKLPDDTEVYPAHGAGSLCGKNMSKETWSTLGNQRQFNYALQSMPKTEFVKMMTENLPEQPAYFLNSVATNLAGASSLEEIAEPEAMSPMEVQNFQGVVLDVRSAGDYGARHIPNSINIGLGGQFASWAGALIEIGTPIVLTAETEFQIEEAVMRLARVGHESVKGYILMKDWAWETKEIEQVSVEEMSELTKTEKYLQFVDVRRETEYENGHAPRTINLTLSDLHKLTDKLDKSTQTFVICQGGYRSSAGTSILERAGFRKLYNVTGGTGAWIKAGLETEN
jgi:hydroxyacylglutathione hydrolase